MKLKIVDTSLRDGHQSLIATRLTTDEIISVIDEMDKVGYHALEVWGGATFDACLRFLNEDPWERLRLIRKHTPNTKLQMLLRGQNLLGYKHYSDDIVDLFVKKSIENGIDIIRVFDALNDVRNLRQAVESTIKYGAECQIALSYTTSPVHTIDYYVELAKEVEALGASSLCIKDMAGVLLPLDAFELISELKNSISIPIELHTHSTGGVAEMTILKAIEAGIDIIDTALSPFGGGTSQPTTEAIFYTLQGTVSEPNLNVKHMVEAAERLGKIRDKYLANGQLNPKALMTDPNILTYQVPGGMLSNLMSQLKTQGASDRYLDVLKEVPYVRADLGYPPLVTPLSQMVGTQAVLNVLSGERYKMVPNEIKEYLKGLYGKSPAPINEEFRRSIIGDEEVITYRPADNLEPQYELLKEKYQDLVTSDEDILSCALFEKVAVDFFKRRQQKEDVEEVVEINLYIGQVK